MKIELYYTLILLQIFFITREIYKGISIKQ